jgi:hypothetical protein
MILLVTASGRAFECAAALRDALGEPVAVAESLASATALLCTEDYLAVVLDQYLIESDPGEAGTMIDRLGTTTLVQVNFAISGIERLVREVRRSLQRRRGDEGRARHAAIDILQSELNGVVTALLLSSELALQTPGLTAGASEKVKSIHALVKDLRRQLEGGAAAWRSNTAGRMADHRQ